MTIWIYIVEIIVYYIIFLDSILNCLGFVKVGWRVYLVNHVDVSVVLVCYLEVFGFLTLFTGKWTNVQVCDVGMNLLGLLCL